MSNLHKIVALMFAVVLCQDIYALHGEYFWNNDPGIDRATAISIVDSDGDGYYDVSFPTADIPEGLNLFGFRVRYSSCWSTTTTALVWIPSEKSDEIFASEYFFDTDPGIGKANPIAGLTGPAAQLTEAVIPTEGLTPGIHLLGIRVKGADGWSTTTTATVKIVDNKLMSVSAAEYYWSTDPDNVTAIPITPGREVEISDLTVPFPEQDAEKYTIYFMVKTGEQWYQVYSNTYVNVPLTAISLSDETLDLKTGQTADLTVTTEPEAALFTDYELSSADETIATVDSDGRVVAVAEGETNITATSKRYPDISDVCKVTVINDISSVTSDIAGRLTARGETGGIVVSSEREDVRIYTSTGICIKELGICDDVFVAAASGVYFVSSDDRVIKVIVR